MKNQNKKQQWWTSSLNMKGFGTRKQVKEDKILSAKLLLAAVQVGQVDKTHPDVLSAKVFLKRIGREDIINDSRKK